MPADTLAGGFLTVVGTIFLAELTDKDALLILSLATRIRPLVVFAAGSIAFTATSALIVILGSLLVSVVPISLVKVIGGAIMLCYAFLEYRRGTKSEKNAEEKGIRVFGHFGRRELYAFIGILGSLMLLDLAGDATELLTVVFVAQFGNILLVFTGAVVALVMASALESALGARLGRVLSARAVRKISVAIFLVIGAAIVLTSGIVP